MTQPEDYQPSQRFMKAVKQCVSEGIKFEDGMNVFIEQAKSEGYSDTDIVNLSMNYLMSRGEDYESVIALLKELREQLQIMKELRQG